MPISSRRCGMITKREAERLCKSFLGDNSPPKLPENFAFEVRNYRDKQRPFEQFFTTKNKFKLDNLLDW